jgi:uncharacterized membrane protein (UPF0127 family)
MRSVILASAVVAIGSIGAIDGCSRGPARGDDRGSVAIPPGNGVDSSSGRPPPAVPTARVILEGSSGPSTVEVEVVSSPGLVQKGLMYRKFLGADAGMLFLMPDVDDHYFWMKNTLISLDIAFISEDFTVVGILENMQPHDTNSKGVGAPSRYVLEVNGGWAKAHGVATGTRVRFEGVEAAAR